MKRFYTGITISVILIGCLWLTSFVGSASDAPVSSGDLRKQIAEKLASYSRLQDAMKTLSQMDTGTGNDGSGFSVQDALQQVNDLGTNIDGLATSIDQIQNAKQDNQESYSVIMGQVKKVLIDIKLTRQTLLDNITKINLYTKSILQTIQTISQTKEYLANTQETIAQLLPTLYILQNNYTNQAGEIDDLKLLLGSGSVTQTLSLNDMLQGLSTKMDSLLSELGSAQERYKQSLDDMYTTRKQLKQLTIGYHDKLITLEEQKGYLVAFLQLAQQNKISLDASMQNIFETRTQLKTRINALVQQITTQRGTPQLAGQAGYEEFSMLRDTREQRSNFLLWPTLPIVTIGTFFGNSVHIGNESEPFSGMQAIAEQGQEVFAPADGWVYYAQDQDGIGVNRIVIVHNNGYISVFTNLNHVFPQTHDVVRRGQVIGTIGGQPGTRGAGWFTTQAMLTMQVFKDGVAVDPLQILDLSIFPSNTLLPDTYKKKYEEDMRLRNNAIDLSNIVFAQGIGLEERRLSFLTEYGAAPYNDITLWEQAAEGTHIDPDLGICIAYAETSLGRAFASKNNVGNVGNNDRGDRVDKASVFDGARAIFDVLNNDYLGHYYTIYDLSGYGNKDGAIYASSQYNWQKNVSRCLSTIKGYIVPEDYPFRTMDIGTGQVN